MAFNTQDPAVCIFMESINGVKWKMRLHNSDVPLGVKCYIKTPFKPKLSGGSVTYTVYVKNVL